MPRRGTCLRSRLASRIAVEVNHIVIPSADNLAEARLLGCVLGLDLECAQGELVRIRATSGLMLDFPASETPLALQCAFLVSGAEFDDALARLRHAAIIYFAHFDGDGRGEISRFGGRVIYFDGLEGHLFELIEKADGPSSSIKALAVKYAY